MSGISALDPDGGQKNGETVRETAPDPDGGQKNGETVRETAPSPDGGQKNGETVRETAPDPDSGAARKVPYILIVAVISSSKFRSRSR